jgi:hypothetical protein
VVNGWMDGSASPLVVVAGLRNGSGRSPSPSVDPDTAAVEVQIDAPQVKASHGERDVRNAVPGDALEPRSIVSTFGSSRGRLVLNGSQSGALPAMR